MLDRPQRQTTNQMLAATAAACRDEEIECCSITISGSDAKKQKLFEKMWDIKHVVKVTDHYYGPRIVRAGVVEILDRRIIDQHVYYDVKYMDNDYERENNVSGDFLCDEPIRRSFRRSLGVERTDVQLLFQRIANNDPTLAVLRAKQFLDATTHASVLEKMFTLLASNNTVQALYVQNLENGMTDQTLALLTKMLKQNCRIWALNVGENFKVTTKGWERFAIELKETSVTHLYAGSESTVHGELKTKMRDAIRENRTKHNLHCAVENLEVIQKIGQMWWNPKNSSLLKCDQPQFVRGEPIAVAVVTGKKSRKWEFGIIEEKEEKNLFYKVLFHGDTVESRWCNLLDETLVVDKQFVHALAFHAHRNAWWPILYFAQADGFVAFVHADVLMNERFEPCECRASEYILPFEYKDHECIAQRGNEQWLEAVALCERRFV